MKKLLMVWDYRMRWAASGRQADHRAGGRPYPYGTRVFLEDFRSAVDFLSAHGYDAIAPWGLFRDSHGGEESVKRLCDHAAHRGIGILATVNTRTRCGCTTPTAVATDISGSSSGRPWSNMCSSCCCM